MSENHLPMPLNHLRPLTFRCKSRPSRTIAISGSRKRLSKIDRLVRESAALRCSRRRPTRGNDPPSRRTRVYQCQRLARQQGSLANQGSEPNRRAQRGYTPRSGPRMAASSASTQLRPSRPHRAGHQLPHSLSDAAPPPSLSETPHELRLPDWAIMRPSFTLRRFTESRERPRSMARGQEIIHTAALHRESIASGCSGRGPTRGRRSTSRRMRFYRRNGLARQRGSPASRGSEPNRRAQRGYTTRPDHEWPLPAPRRRISPLRSLREGSPASPSPHGAAPPPSLSET